MKTSTIVASALALAMFSAGAFAKNELMVTSEKSSRGQMSALDLVSDGTATAIQARFTVAGGENATAVLEGCAKSLPKTHGGQCAYNKGTLTVLVYSDSNALLPRGLVSLGTVGFKGTTAAPVLSELLAFDAAGKEISISANGDVSQRVAK